MSSFRETRKCWIQDLLHLCADAACYSSVELIVGVSGATTSRSFLGTQLRIDYCTGKV